MIVKLVKNKKILAIFSCVLYLYLFSEEVTLDYVVERKREDDFISSILDGRYEEQKVSFIHAFLATLGIHAINSRLFHSCIFG